MKGKSLTWVQRREAAIRSAATAAIRDPEADAATVEAAMLALEPEVSGFEIGRALVARDPAGAALELAAALGKYFAET